MYLIKNVNTEYYVLKLKCMSKIKIKKIILQGTLFLYV